MAKKKKAKGKTKTTSSSSASVSASSTPNSIPTDVVKHVYQQPDNPVIKNPPKVGEPSLYLDTITGKVVNFDYDKYKYPAGGATITASTPAQKIAKALKQQNAMAKSGSKTAVGKGKSKKAKKMRVVGSGLIPAGQKRKTVRSKKGYAGTAYLQGGVQGVPTTYIPGITSGSLSELLRP